VGAFEAGLKQEHRIVLLELRFAGERAVFRYREGDARLDARAAEKRDRRQHTCGEPAKPH
jgi:hypothetical protein